MSQGQHNSFVVNTSVVCAYTAYGPGPKPCMTKQVDKHQVRLKFKLSKSCQAITELSTERLEDLFEHQDQET